MKAKHDEPLQTKVVFVIIACVFTTILAISALIYVGDVATDTLTGNTGKTSTTLEVRK
jgi:hypothetical protein